MHSYIGEDGILHIIADRSSTRRQIQALDLGRARLLSKLSNFWERRVQELAPQLQQLLGVDNVWCDTRTQQSQQKFVLWGGYVLEKRREFERALVSPNFQFSLLVHSDTSSPMVDFLPSSPVLQVRSDCQPEVLLDFLCSEEANVADEAAAAVESGRIQEERLLEQVRLALNAKHVIRVCSIYDQNKAMEAAQRLLDFAEQIKKSVDLTGASIAIDDCYEVWESGTISIPYDFEVTDLPPKLQKMLGGGMYGDIDGQGQGQGQQFDNNQFNKEQNSRRREDHKNGFNFVDQQEYTANSQQDGVIVNAVRQRQKLQGFQGWDRRYLQGQVKGGRKRLRMCTQRFVVTVQKMIL
eukprot:TRINITY_DN2604_c1_g1_i1.p1 TRINITY_DN2604_c1_g1~~TRINITY_DN2604_c1_g1_i1.p1  ORF type:complete len:352 (-),score=49.94 TRINITY_DN2604_c1_g1_i1:168-1223(-)